MPMSEAPSVEISIDRLQPNPWNTNIVPPENEAKLETSIKDLGFFRPIIVRTLEHGELEILGGQHRWQVAQRLGIKTVPVHNLGHVEDKLAKKISLADNARYGHDDTMSLADLLNEVGTKEEIAAFLPYTNDDLAAILTTSNVALDDLDLPGDQSSATLPQLPTPTHQMMRFKVPVEDAAWVVAMIERVMKEQGFTTEDSQTNAGNALVFVFNAHKNS